MRRAWILWPAAILCALALAWLSAIVYVHSKARRDVETLLLAAHKGQDLYYETKCVAIQGCRALPALISELDPAADPKRLQHVVATLRWLIVSDYEIPYAREKPPDVARASQALSADFGDLDSPAERGRKIDGLRAWWKAEGPGFHEPWRFWSKKCRAESP